MEPSFKGDEARELAEHLLSLYYNTQSYPWTRHHIDSYDQFLSQDLPAIIQASNPLILLEQRIGTTDVYAYKAEIFIGGVKGDQLFIGSPTLRLQGGDEVRLLFPSEARLRNLTYSSLVQADITIRITFSKPDSSGEPRVLELDAKSDPSLSRFPLFRIPILLHSRFCVLHQKPPMFLKEAGECEYDYGGYFIIDGSEKVLITRQEQAFNTLYVQNQERDPKFSLYGSISCLNPKTRQIRRIGFTLDRRANTLEVSIPFVRKSVPIFVLFRALGIQSDKDILQMIFPNFDSDEAKLLMPLLQESIVHAHPFLDTYTAVNYIRVLTKGFGVEHVLDVLHNHLFVHVEDRPYARAMFLGECVRKILRVHSGIDQRTDRDDTRNQRCLTSGFLTRMLFQDVYSKWVKLATQTLDKEYKYNSSIYTGENFKNLFSPGTLSTLLQTKYITEGITRGFKGKWGEGAEGVLQALSRLSYMDFLSHCRRVLLNFDTGMKLQGPRRLHTSQFGYFCTNETPGGASIGITKNLSNLAAISTYCSPTAISEWLLSRAGVIPCEDVTPDVSMRGVPVFINSGIMGFTLRPVLLVEVLKCMKWTGCLPPSASIGFNIRDRQVFLYVDEGRPIRPLIHLMKGGVVPAQKLRGAKRWRDLILGSFGPTQDFTLSSNRFLDPLASKESPALEDYKDLLLPHIGCIEYVDPYEANETYIACFPEQIQSNSSHLEIHPSTMFGLMTSMIPYANHNQSPRNQLSCSQSKQGLSVYATNYPSRFDNQVHVSCYSEAPLVRTLYYDHVANGQMAYGHNIILAMGCFSGYNQEDGIVMNADALQRGLFHNMSFRSYEIFEEDDTLAHTESRIANPAKYPPWTNLRAGLDYSKLDERGIIREGEWVDETTVLVGRYIQSESGEIRDASLTAQVWTTGRVEKVAVMLNNAKRALVKVRVSQYRTPELGDKFSNRHGQKGTLGMAIRGHDMPRSESGIVPDMIMNTHAIPSRMTIAQLLESLLGKSAALLGAIGNATTFMNTGSPAEAIGKVLRDTLGMEPMGEEMMYDGTTGVMVPSTFFVGNVYTMRLKHMTEDKWNARAEGRREQRTHQPTGGRGNQGGLRIGEMERDAIIGHGIASFVHESYMKRADGTDFTVCNGCGTIPIYNDAEKKYVCSLCDGPVRYIGETVTNLELVPPIKRSTASFSKIEIPYAFKLLEQELSTYMNIGMRYLTTADLQTLSPPALQRLTRTEQEAALKAPLPQRLVVDTVVPEFIQPVEEDVVRPEDLSGLGVMPPAQEEEAKEEAPLAPVAVAPPPQVAQPPPPVAASPYLVVPMNNAQVAAMLPPAAAPLPQEGEEFPMQTSPEANILSPGIPGANFLATGIPGAPPMISIDTSENALQAQGLGGLQQPVRTAMKRAASAPRAPAQGGGSPYSGNIRVNVIREP